MNKLDNKTRAQIVSCLVEGNSIRATARMTGAAINTVVKLLCDVGKACADYQDKHMRNLPCRKLQCDEIWSFCYAKEKNVPADKRGTFGFGDVWTWTAIDAETKLVPCWLVGPHHAEAALEFLKDVADRMADRVQLTTDGNRAYLEAVSGAFGGGIDYAMLIKIYGPATIGDVRYSQPRCIRTFPKAITGNPDLKHASTSFVERQNLTMRMSMRRFTRLTNGFSKKVENLACAVALHFMHYNFCRIHQSLRVTPAMQAGLSDHVWTIEEMVALIDAGSN